jgi:hypothetical protein
VFHRTILLLVSGSLAFAQQGYQPPTQEERTSAYWKSLASPSVAAIALASAGIRQATDSPEEWDGAKGFGYRVADVYGRRVVRVTVQYGLASALHEDNRYFQSGAQGFWPRTRYAIASTFLARHDDGSRGISVSRLSGTAAAGFTARLWLPESQRNIKDASGGIGIALGIETGMNVFREFWPDLKRKFRK